MMMPNKLEHLNDTVQFDKNQVSMMYVTNKLRCIFFQTKTTVLFNRLLEFIMTALLPVISLSSATLMGHCFSLGVTYLLHLKLRMTTRPIIGHC